MRVRRFLLLLSLLVAGVAGAVVARSAATPEPRVPARVDAAGVPDETPRPATPAPRPTPTSAPSPEAAPPPDYSRLASALRRIVDRPDLQLSAPLGIAVLDANGNEVLAVGADRPLMPASTNKLLIAAGAMLELGPAHRFETEVVAPAAINDRGVIVGDLTLIGAGDPSLATDDYDRWIYPVRPNTSLDELADRLVEAGLHRVIGSVVGDGTAFQGPTVARGWKDEYLQDLNARHVTGLTVDAGLDWWIEEPPPGVQLEIHRSDDPVLEAATRLDALLRQRGVKILGRPAVATSSPEGPREVIASVRSPQLGRMLAHTLQRSDNHMADMLLPVIGLAARGRGSWIDGALALREGFGEAGLDLTGMIVDDGSGLSRADRVTGRQLAGIDAHLTTRFGEAWRDLMAVTGETGTLRGRLRGTIAERRFFGKTGTLDDVLAIVGQVTGVDGGRYHLAVMANDLSGGERWKVYVLMDELILSLVAHLDGCRLVAPSPAPSPREPYRSATSC